MTKQGYFSCFGYVPRSDTKNPFQALSPYKLRVGIGVLCLILTNVVAQSIPWVVKWTVEAITGQGGDSRTLPMLCTLLVGMALLQGVIRVGSRLQIFNAGRDAEYDLRRSLFSRLCQLDGNFYRRYRTGDLMSRLTNDLSSVRALYGPGILHVVNTVFAYAVALPLMIHIDPWLTLWSLVPYVVLLAGARLFARGIYNRSKDMQVSLASMTTTVQENLVGIRELKNYSLESHRNQLFGESSRVYLDQAMRLARWRAGLIPFVGLGAGASVVVALWLGGTKVIQGQITLGDLVAFNLYVGLLAWPTMAIGWMMSLWHRGRASWERLQDILGERSALEVEEIQNTKYETRNRERGTGTGHGERGVGHGERGVGNEERGVGHGERGVENEERGVENEERGVGHGERGVEIEGEGSGLDIEVRELRVGFGDKEVLKGISLQVPAGSLCAVVGRVGCGKTTLAEALARLLVVPDGSLLVGGEDVNRLPVEWVRAQVAYAPQSAFLFSISIGDNISLGLDAGIDPASEEARQRIQRAVRAAGLEPDLEGFTDGLDTVVGERGLSLSGGQRQRVALARALVTDRPILILDDSLSSVDSGTEKRILGQLQEVLRGRTAILISHRLSALQHARQVVVLEQGRVAEVGRHEELLEAGGIYAELYRKQVLRELR